MTRERKSARRQAKIDLSLNELIPPRPADKAPPLNRGTPADVLAVLEDCRVECTRDQNNEAVIAVMEKSEFTRWPLKSGAATYAMRRLYEESRSWRDSEGRLRAPPVSKTTMQTVAETLAARAAVAPRRRHGVRAIEHQGEFWIDLGGASWEAVRIGAAGGWEIADAREVPFLRPAAMLPLPRPVHRQEAMVKLRELFNPLNDLDYQAVLKFMVMALVAREPHGILTIYGPESSGKSTMATMIRMLTDPSELGLITKPEQLQDAMVAAEHARTIVLDNVLEMTPELSNWLCDRSDGRVAPFREKYSDRDLIILRFGGPTIVTGVSSLIKRPDLASRGLIVNAGSGRDDDEEIATRARGEVLGEMETIVPGVLAALLDAIALGLAREAKGDATLYQAGSGRMLHHDRLWLLVAAGLGFTTTDVQALRVRQDEQRQGVVHANNPLMATLLEVLENETGKAASSLQAAKDGRWSVTLTGLLKLLNETAPFGWRDREWPASPGQLSRAIDPLTKMLARFGWRLTRKHAQSAKHGWNGYARWLEFDPIGSPDGAAEPEHHAPRH